MTRVLHGLDGLRAVVGETLGPSTPFVVDQATIDAFAEATCDRQWIHVDVERARRENGGTIAHGMLTLSLIVPLVTDVYAVDEPVAINYGFDRVRFPAAVPVDAEVTATLVIAEVQPGPGGTKVGADVTLRASGVDAPVCVARWWTFYPTLITDQEAAHA